MRHILVMGLQLTLGSFASRGIRMVRSCERAREQPALASPSPRCCDDLGHLRVPREPVFTYKFYIHFAVPRNENVNGYQSHSMSNRLIFALAGVLL